jgi:hypothetical protein
VLFNTDYVPPLLYVMEMLCAFFELRNQFLNISSIYVSLGMRNVESDGISAMHTLICVHPIVLRMLLLGLTFECCNVLRIVQQTHGFPLILPNSQSLFVLVWHEHWLEFNNALTRSWLLMESVLTGPLRTGTQLPSRLEGLLIQCPK